MWIYWCACTSALGESSKEYYVLPLLVHCSYMHKVSKLEIQRLGVCNAVIKVNTQTTKIKGMKKVRVAKVQRGGV